MENRNSTSIKKTEKGVTYFERPTVIVDGQEYRRLAIQTHFVQRKESYFELYAKYVEPLAEAGDILSWSEKIITLCQDHTVDIEDVKLGWWAKNLSKLATSNDAGIAMDEPYKLQLAINLAGLPRILFAVFCGGVGKILGKNGWFYKVAGHNIAGIDGFYSRSSFKEYHTMAMLGPREPDRVCIELYERFAIANAIVDANDFGCVLLGSAQLPDKEVFMKIIKDNPAGQSDEMTPLILIKKKN